MQPSTWHGMHCCVPAGPAVQMEGWHAYIITLDTRLIPQAVDSDDVCLPTPHLLQMLAGNTLNIGV